MTMTAKTNAPSPRGLRLKERLLSSSMEIDLERAREYTKTWQEEQDSAPCLRTARALQRTLRTMTIRIDDGDLFAGVKTAKMLGAILGVERNPEASVIENSVGSSRTLAERRRLLDPAEQEELSSEILPYWRGRSSASLKYMSWLQDPELYDKDRQSFLAHELVLVVLDTQGHTIPGYTRVLEWGFEGIRERAALRLSELKEGDAGYEESKDFLESVLVVTEAVRDYTQRYVELAEKEAAKANGQRKQELLDIAERCRRVPMQPPRDFMEAVQSFWMTHVVLVISYGVGDVFSTGRIDQYLYPYYKADLEAGRVTPEAAQEALEEVHLKMATSILPAHHTITIGGLGRDGGDATNDISFMILDIVSKLGALKNNIAIRISPKTQREFMFRAWETHRIGAGVAFYNDEIIMRDLLADGYAIEDARDYSIVGCVEPTTTGRDFSYTAGNSISIGKTLELALNGGRLLGSDVVVGAPTPLPEKLQSFPDVRDAFAAQIAFGVDRCVKAAEHKDRAYAESFPTPALSSTLIGCLESGKDATRGGAMYNNGHMGMEGLATAVNSLTAVRWAVFEQKILTLPELLQHLSSNFEGAETLRQELARKPPKYGNDNRSADEIAEWVVQTFCDEVRKHKCGRGGVYRPLVLSSGFQVFEGLLCKATPDGRRAGEPITDGISPAHGTEMNGLTAVLHSAAAAGKALVSDGSTLTLTLSPGLLKDEESIDKLVSLIQGYFRLGGRQVQFTPVDTETLLDAQAHPEKYPDLSVKVSGYSAIFVDLPKSLQDDIIARTEFHEV